MTATGPLWTEGVIAIQVPDFDSAEPCRVLPHADQTTPAITSRQSAANGSSANLRWTSGLSASRQAKATSGWSRAARYRIAAACRTRRLQPVPPFAGTLLAAL
jgi:hypothetical protein